MTVEFDPGSSTIYIDDLNASYPAGTDQKKEGDNHIRGIKKILLNTFPNIDGPVSVTDSELDTLDGMVDDVADAIYGLHSHNLFLNPEFRFANGCNSGAGATGYVADEWKIRNDTTATNYVWSAPNTTLTYDKAGAFIMINTEAGAIPGSDAFGFEQSIEDVTVLAGKKVAVSIWCRVLSDASNAVTVTCKGIQQFDSPNGGSAAVTVTSETSPIEVAVNDSERLVYLFDMPSVAGKTLGSNGIPATRTTFQFLLSHDETKVRFMEAQCEIVSSLNATATQFSAPGIGAQEAALQRYYQTHTFLGMPAVANSASRGSAVILFPVAMRLEPTMTTTDTQIWSASLGWTSSGVGWTNSEIASGNKAAKLDVDKSSAFTTGEALRYQGTFMFDARF